MRPRYIVCVSIAKKHKARHMIRGAQKFRLHCLWGDLKAIDNLYILYVLCVCYDGYRA